MIYFIQDSKSKAIKIGVSQNPVKRLAALQVAHHSKLLLIGVMDGSRATEESLHNLFTRRQGEWFEPTRDLMAFIRENAVSTSALTSITRPRAKGSSAFDGFEPELRGGDLISMLARLAIHKGWRDQELTEIVGIIYPVHEKYSALRPDLVPRLSREEIQRKVEQLVTLQKTRLAERHNGPSIAP